MARIYLEVELISVHQKYELETDDEISGKDFKDKLIQEIENIESYSKLDCDISSLYNLSNKKKIVENRSLKDNGVISGDYFYLI